MKLPSILQTNRRRDLALFAVALASVTLYVLVAGEGLPLDDSWIHQVYARNLAEGGEWAFVPGEPSGASTSPLYTVVLAIGYVLNLPFYLWTHLLGIMALAAAGMLAVRIVEVLQPQKKLAALAAGFAIILSWHLLWAAASGMETMIFALFTLLLPYLAMREAHTALEDGFSQRGALFGVLSALAMATRPEGILLAGICGLVVALFFALKRTLTTMLHWGIAATLGFIVAITPYLLLNLQLNDSILPATSDAKYAQHAPLLQLPYLDRFTSLVEPILVGGQLLLIPGMIFYVLWAIRQRDGQLLVRLIPLLWAISLIALYAARLPAAYQHGRYVIPALPGMIVIGVLGTAELIQAGRRSLLGRVFSRTLAIAATLTLIYFGAFLGPTIYRQDIRIINEEMVAPAKWIADNLPDETLLAVHDIGAVGYYTRRPILDIAGLVSTEVVPRIGDADALWALMQERNAAYLMAFPDQIPGQNPDDERLCFLYQSNGETSRRVGGPKMVIYQIAWDGVCP